MIQDMLFGGGLQLILRVSNKGIEFSRNSHLFFTSGADAVPARCYLTSMSFTTSVTASC